MKKKQALKIAEELFEKIRGILTTYESLEEDNVITKLKILKETSFICQQLSKIEVDFERLELDKKLVSEKNSTSKEDSNLFLKLKELACKN